jgi:serine phosphatase RsbU (regulator of sigma subunit)
MTAVQESPAPALRSDAATAPAAAVRVDRGPVWRWRASRPASIALVLGLLLTAGLAITALAVYNSNEDRLLKLRVRELALVLSSAVPTTQTPLASAAELAEATHGDPAKFRAFAAPLVGKGRQFQSVSLWPLGRQRLAPTAVVGAPPRLASMPTRARQFLERGVRPGVINLTGFLHSPHPSVGIAFKSAGHPGYVVYSENPLPANRRSRQESNAAFSDLDYVLYLGHSTRSSDVIITSEKHLPIKGRQAKDVVPFGAASFTLVAAPKGSLGGAFFQSLPWIIGVVGALMALAAALLTDRLSQRRARAEELAGILDGVAAENRRMYAEQRGISQTLQHALLPEALPQVRGLRVIASYVPAASGVEVGGDWYDLVAIDDKKAFLLIGDVAGHGLRAATTMAMLRHAALAYIVQDSSPGSVLHRLSDFVNRERHDYFATVLCALIDVDSHRITMASAGHLAPLILHDGRGEFAQLEPDAPIGVQWEAQYREATVSVPSKAVVVAFTDGLVERRGEVIDVGLARLRDLATRQRLALDDLLAQLAVGLAAEDHNDDTAMVGIQWTS